MYFVNEYFTHLSAFSWKPHNLRGFQILVLRILPENTRASMSDSIKLHFNHIARMQTRFSLSQSLNCTGTKVNETVSNLLHVFPHGCQNYIDLSETDRMSSKVLRPQVGAQSKLQPDHNKRMCPAACGLNSAQTSL